MAVAVKIEMAFHRIARREVVISHPAIRAGLERISLRHFEVAFVFQVISEERSLNLFAEVARRGALELNSPQRVALAARPSAVIPRPGDEKVQALGISLLLHLISLDRAVEIFLIPPSGHVERRHGDVSQVEMHRTLLPILIEARVRDETLPRWVLPFRQLVGDVGEGPE